MLDSTGAVIHVTPSTTLVTGYAPRVSLDRCKYNDREQSCSAAAAFAVDEKETMDRDRTTARNRLADWVRPPAKDAAVGCVVDISATFHMMTLRSDGVELA